MPVVPAPCGSGEGGEPGAGCCSASISSVALCLPDGTPLVLVVRSPCSVCEAGGSDPEVAGWIDPATGALTPGPAPGEARPCPAEDGSCGDVALLRLCDLADGTCTPFWRHLVHDCDGQVVTQVDTAVDGVTPYVPAGEVGDCETGPCSEPPCQRPAMCPGLVGLSGPETWTILPGTESVNLSVVCGPVTVYPCDGAVDGVEIRECGTTLAWSAPGSECAPGQLCDGFRVHVPEGAAVYVSWLAAGCGDES